jgi:hypothetical protein
LVSGKNHETGLFKSIAMTYIFIGFCTAFALLIGAAAFLVWVVNDNPERNLTGELEDDILRW